MLCPVCNGLEPLDAVCGGCGGLAEDWGRQFDWLGPYSPYEQQEGEHYVTTDQSAGAKPCKHWAYCSSCGSTTQVEVNEIV